MGKEVEGMQEAEDKSVEDDDVYPLRSVELQRRETNKLTTRGTAKGGEGTFYYRMVVAKWQRAG